MVQYVMQLLWNPHHIQLYFLSDSLLTHPRRQQGGPSAWPCTARETKLAASGSWPKPGPAGCCGHLSAEPVAGRAHPLCSFAAALSNKEGLQAGVPGRAVSTDCKPLAPKKNSPLQHVPWETFVAPCVQNNRKQSAQLPAA